MSASASGRVLERVSVGTVPILWNNVDLAEGAPLVPAETVLNDIARLGYDGCQLGRGFPAGAELRAALGKRSLRLAEVYVALSLPGSVRDARESGLRSLDALRAGGGEVLVIALDGGGARDAWSGRAGSNSAAPRLDHTAWADLAAVLNELGDAARTSGHTVAFHPHTGTYVETPEEVATLSVSTDPESVGICLDTGHYLVGGGDPTEAIRTYGARVRHVHLKDVDPNVLARLRGGEFGGFRDAIAERLFTELGSGILDVEAVLAELDAVDYAGWLMVEQDTSWLPPSEAAAVGRRVLDYALRRLARKQAA